MTLEADYFINPINPLREATSTEQRMNWCAWHHKQSKTFLAHLNRREDVKNEMQQSREVKAPRAPVINQKIVKQFPEDKFEDLLWKGFIRPHSNSTMPREMRYDYGSIAITLLLNRGGLRKSEVFHLFCGDVILNPVNKTDALVRIYHPAYGISPLKKYNDRRELLMQEYGLLPRNEYLCSNKFHAGWKGAVLSDRRRFFEVIFCPTKAAILFLEVLRLYIKHQRVDPPKTDHHPYLFTNSHGLPETIKNFQRKHANAVRRIGLEPQKNSGTTEHGHRHAYGYRLAKMEMKQIDIQKAMHHVCPESCLVYTQPTDEDVSNKMKEIENE